MGEGDEGSKVIAGRAEDTARMRSEPNFGRVVTSFPGGEDGWLPVGEGKGGGCGFFASPDTFAFTRIGPVIAEPAGLGGVETSPGSGTFAFAGVRTPREEKEETRWSVKLSLRRRGPNWSPRFDTDGRERSSGEASPERACIAATDLGSGARAVNRAFTG